MAVAVIPGVFAISRKAGRISTTLDEGGSTSTSWQALQACDVSAALDLFWALREHQLVVTTCAGRRCDSAGSPILLGATPALYRRRPTSCCMVSRASPSAGRPRQRCGRAPIELWGTARAVHAALIRELGARPIDYQREDFTRLVPDGFDVVFDGIA